MRTVEVSTYNLSPRFLAQRPTFNHYVWFRASLMDGFLKLMTEEEKEVALRIMFTECMWDHHTPDISMSELMKRMIR